jgi:hypothetical protein
MTGLEILPVTSRSEMSEFIELPWRIYEGYPLWAPPIKSHVRRLLDTSTHPFWEFSKQALFLARRGPETIGRIAGIIDGNYNDYHNERMAGWGFFECREDTEAASALFGAVEEWARGKRMEFLRGPLSPSMNYECGTLIEGFGYAPVIMMPYNPPYYPALIESSGFTKEKDLISVWLEDSAPQSPRIERLLRRVRRNPRITIRTLDMKNLKADFTLLNEVFRECWAQNWGFVPMSPAEMLESIRDLPKIADPDLIFFPYYEDEPAGVCMLLPDVNPLLKRLNGKMGLLGLLKIQLHRKEIQGLRGVLFGFKERYQKFGVSLASWDYVNRKSREKGYRRVEMGWNLEDNRGINQFDLALGGFINKRFRLYKKEL